MSFHPIMKLKTHLDVDMYIDAWEKIYLQGVIRCNDIQKLDQISLYININFSNNLPMCLYVSTHFIY